MYEFTHGVTIADKVKVFSWSLPRAQPYDLFFLARHVIRHRLMGARGLRSYWRRICGISGGLLHTGSGLKEITLAGLVGSLAPNPDVAIVAAEREKETPVAKPGDWLRIADQDLLFRLRPETILGGNKDAGDAPKLLQPIVDNVGCVHGRACIWPTDAPEFWASNDWGVLTIGGLRSSTLRNVRGVLVGEALTIARNAGRPTAPLGALAKWASMQAVLIAETIKDEQQQAGSAEVVLECGGEVGDLKIVRWGMEWLSASEFKARLRDLEKIAVSLQGDFVYDEGEDDVLPRDFEWSFCVSDDVVVVLKCQGNVVRAGKNSWPKCATQLSGSEFSKVADLVKDLIRDVWGDNVEESLEKCVVGNGGWCRHYPSATCFSFSGQRSYLIIGCCRS